MDDISMENAGLRGWLWKRAYEVKYNVSMVTCCLGLTIRMLFYWGHLGNIRIYKITEYLENIVVVDSI